MRKKISVSGVDSRYLILSRFTRILELSNFVRSIKLTSEVAKGVVSTRLLWYVPPSQGVKQEIGMQIEVIATRMRDAKKKFDRVWGFL